MLPDENLVKRKLRRRFASELAEMDRVLEVVTTIIGGGQLKITKTRGLNPTVVWVVVGLLAKAAKTSRAIQLCCETGLGHDANVLNRQLFETTAAIAFILRRTPRLRTGMYAAHIAQRQLVMVESWMRTNGLKRMATKALLASARRAVADWNEKIGTEATRSVKKHWSGHSIEWTATYLGLGQAYQLFYRFSSPSAHAGDVSEHVQVTANEDVTVMLAPSDNLVQACLVTASAMLWDAARVFNTRLGLEHTQVLEAGKPVAVVEEENRRAARQRRRVRVRKR